jgi:hypothetical protein
MFTQLEPDVTSTADEAVEMTYRDAVNAALEDEMASDSRVYPLGEDVANDGGVFKTNALIVWTQAVLLDGDLANAEPKRVRYRLLHVAARLAFHGRQAKLHLQATWPWASELVAAFARLKALPAAAG